MVQIIKKKISFQKKKTGRTKH